MRQQKLAISPQAAELHWQLSEVVREKIKAADGVLPFAEFMRLALYHPGLGYYQNGLHKFGHDGDFVTAPELGQNFARCMARSLSPLPCDERERLLEIGAGSGALACGLLAALARQRQLPKQYFILEPSAALQAQQRERLARCVPDFASRVSWLTQLPQDFCGVIIANEVVDALPCERVQKMKGRWHRLGVTCYELDAKRGGELSETAQFDWQLMDALQPGEIPSCLRDDESYAEGYRSETRPLVHAWLAGLGQSLARGHLLLVDYGYAASEYYHPQRDDGTLRCYSRHLAHADPLQLLGLQDITAHVDFSDVVASAESAGLSVAGFTTQAGYLLENGLLDVQPPETGGPAEQVERLQFSREVQILTAPGQMGEAFKVLALQRNAQGQIQGFTLQDRLHSL